MLGLTGSLLGLTVSIAYRPKAYRPKLPDADARGQFPYHARARKPEGARVPGDNFLTMLAFRGQFPYHQCVNNRHFGADS